MLINFVQHKAVDSYCIFDCKVKENHKYDKILKKFGLEDIKIYDLIKMSEEPVKCNNEPAKESIQFGSSAAFTCIDVENNKPIFLLVKKVKKDFEEYMILHEIGHIKFPPKNRKLETTQDFLLFNVENEFNADIFVFNYYVSKKSIKKIEYLLSLIINRILTLEMDFDRTLKIQSKRNYYEAALLMLHRVFLKRKNYLSHDHYLMINKEKLDKFILDCY